MHLQQQHVGIFGQWLYSWRPRKNTKELALFLEDDLDVSRYFWKWLKAAHKRYGNSSEVQGFSLRGNIIVAGKNINEWLKPRTGNTTFMYKMYGLHGYAPLPQFWSGFQDWIQRVTKDKSFQLHKKLPHILPVKWYKELAWLDANLSLKKNMYKKSVRQRVAT